MHNGPFLSDNDNNTDENEADFRSLGLTRDLLFAVLDQQWDVPTPFQRWVISAILNLEEEDNDIEGETNDSIWSEAPTGSGKTGAFALPLLQILRQRRRDLLAGGGDDDDNNALSHSKVSTLILCPTHAK